MNFNDVKMMLWCGDPDYSKWKYKRRHTVLGLWHQMKLSMWDEHVLMCEENLEWMKMRSCAREPGQGDVSIEDLLNYVPVPASHAARWTASELEPVYEDAVPF